MHIGNISLIPAASIAAAKSAGQATVGVSNLNKVIAASNAVATPSAPAEESMQEVVVTGKRIQWWQWMLAGGAALFAINLVRGK